MQHYLSWKRSYHVMESHQRSRQITVLHPMVMNLHNSCPTSRLIIEKLRHSGQKRMEKLNVSWLHWTRQSVADNVDWKSQLPTFLRLYRDTPHTSTKISPFESLNGRKMKIGLADSPITGQLINLPTVALLKMTISPSMRWTMLTPNDTRQSDLQPGGYVLEKLKRI